MMFMSPILKRALEINRRKSASNKNKARAKLKEFYFKGQFTVESFADIDVKLIPYVLELVTMTDICIDDTSVKACKGDPDGIYCLVRNCCLDGAISSTTPKEAEIQQLKSNISAMEEEMNHILQENRRNECLLKSFVSRRIPVCKI